MTAGTAGLHNGGGSVFGLAELQRKLQLNRGERVAVINAPREARLRLRAAGEQDPNRAEVVIGFASRQVDLAWLRAAFAAARAGRPAWVAYPTPGRPGTDLRREWMVRVLRQYGVDAGQDVSIDHAWSAFRLHPIGAGGGA